MEKSILKLHMSTCTLKKGKCHNKFKRNVFFTYFSVVFSLTKMEKLFVNLLASSLSLLC